MSEENFVSFSADLTKQEYLNFSVSLTFMSSLFICIVLICILYYTKLYYTIYVYSICIVCTMLVLVHELPLLHTGIKYTFICDPMHANVHVFFVM